MRQQTVQKKNNETKKDFSKTYQIMKFQGKQYTGMKVGRSHKWYYDKGEWKEKKITPDKWEFTYAVPKKRAGHAPDGSGVPVGTEYHWYILADQNVKKVDANNYSTKMTGLKFKLADKRADKDHWSPTDNTKKEIDYPFRRIYQQIKIRLET